MITQIMIIIDLSTLDTISEADLESILVDTSQVKNRVTHEILKKEIIKETEE